MHNWAHGEQIGNWITVNGDSGGTATCPHAAAPCEHSECTHLYAGGTGSGGLGLEGWVADLDGMPLETQQPLVGLTLAPAQRADLIVDVVAEEGEDALLVSFERDGGYAIAAFPVAGVARQARLSAPDALQPNPVPALGHLETAARTELRMEGGPMGGMRGAMMGGRMTDMRDMAAAGKVWAFNGMADMGETPLLEAALGDTVRIAMINDTAWPHGMHLHGHHFRQIRTDRTIGPLRDTVLINRGETVEIAFVADNPGDWLLHCHMLEHAAGGMMTWLRVS